MFCDICKEDHFIGVFHTCHLAIGGITMLREKSTSKVKKPSSKVKMDKLNIIIFLLSFIIGWLIGNVVF